MHFILSLSLWFIGSFSVVRRSRRSNRSQDTFTLLRCYTCDAHKGSLLGALPGKNDGDCFSKIILPAQNFELRQLNTYVKCY